MPTFLCFRTLVDDRVCVHMVSTDAFVPVQVCELCCMFLRDSVWLIRVIAALCQVVSVFGCFLNGLCVEVQSQ